MNSQTESMWPKLRKRVRAFIRSRVRDEHLVEDLVQETLLKVYRRISTLRESEKLTSWAMSIARRNVADAFRDQTAISEVALEESDTPVVDSQTEFFDNEILACVFTTLLDAIPEKYAYAVRRCDAEGVKQKRLAEELGLSFSAAKSRVQRGRLLMREKFLECCRLEFDGRGQIFDYQCAKPQVCVFQELPETQKAKVECCVDDDSG